MIPHTPTNPNRAKPIRALVPNMQQRSAQLRTKLTNPKRANDPVHRSTRSLGQPYRLLPSAGIRVDLHNFPSKLGRVRVDFVILQAHRDQKRHTFNPVFQFVLLSLAQVVDHFRLHAK